MRNIDAQGKFLPMVRTGVRASKTVEEAAACAQPPVQKRRLLRDRPKLSDDTAINDRLLRMMDRAAGKGMDFDLDEAWLVEKLSRDFCEVTGLRFEGDGTSAPFSRSIDRTDNSIGYIKSNCKVVVWIYNQAKRHHGHEHVLLMAKALIEREG